MVRAFWYSLIPGAKFSNLTALIFLSLRFRSCVIRPKSLFVNGTYGRQLILRVARPRVDNINEGKLRLKPSVYMYK